MKMGNYALILHAKISVNVCVWQITLYELSKLQENILAREALVPQNV